MKVKDLKRDGYHKTIYFGIVLTILMSCLLLSACGKQSEVEDGDSENETEQVLVEDSQTELTSENEELITSEDIIAEVAIEEILMGTPIIYDCLKIDGWVFEWLVSDYVEKDRWSWEDGVLLVTKEGAPDVVQIIHIEGEGGSGDLGPIKNKFVFEDVNFDEVPDLLVCNGAHGAQGAIGYYCFLQIDGAFMEVPAFADIANPSIDKENRLILSQWRSHAASHCWAEYAYQDGTYVMVRELREDLLIIGENVESSENVWYWTVNDEIIARSDEQTKEEIEELLYGESSEWKLYDDRWRTIYNNGLMADYSIYLSPTE